MNARPRKVEVIILGRGLAAAALADALAQSGRRVALLAEEPGWERGTRPAWRGWHIGAQTAFAVAGAEMLAGWQAAGLPGITEHDVGHAYPFWLLDLDQLLPALGERVAASAGCWVATETRVRGVSVIENAILGVIAEDSRYDARHVVNAAEDERHAAFARMMREPQSLALSHFTPTPDETVAVSASNQVSYPAATPFLRDEPAPTLGPTSVQGAWRIAGVAGWPVLALGAATQLAAQLTAAFPAK
ncbi:MAG TPA: hypothetical protein VF707_02710 [Ardenticatenaceae bacterium]|jgi:hypothetical protein